MAVDLSREPLTLEEARGHLGVRTAFRDDEIKRLIVAARERVESYTGHALKRRVFSQIMEGPRPTFTRGPVHAIKAITALDTGEELVNAARAIGPIGNEWRLYGIDMPAGRNGVLVDYVAGFGDLMPDEEGEVSPVPQLLVQAMLLLVGTWFENHEGAVVGTSATELPFGVKDACRDFRPAGLA